ncbi:MAG TPA: polysaccharide deacetylase family protein, partial [Planctomycetaceae bacterium]|nr:polysaccharide deacetylase family protein [Planctomycetaceae bacterium]
TPKLAGDDLGSEGRTMLTRRQFIAGSAAAALFTRPSRARQPAPAPKQALIAITLDLEMSRHYPRRGMLEWDYEKGNLDEATKQYAVEAGRLVRERGGVVHYFCVGRVLEQPDVDWLKDLARDGHPIGNHTYDHVNVKATTPAETQFRFQRAPWLVAGKTAEQIIRENVALTTTALKQRAGIEPNGFRTPGGFSNGLADRPDVQEMLADAGFTWVSSKYPPHQTGAPRESPAEDVYASIVAAQEHAQPFAYPGGLIEVPMSPISDVGAFRTLFWKLDWFLEATRRSVEWAIRTGRTFDFLAHPSCLVVEDPKFDTIRLICDLVKAAGDRAAIVGLDTIAGQATTQDGVPLRPASRNM